MADLTEATTLRKRDRGITSVIATDAIQFFGGGLVGVNKTTGRIVKWADTATFEFMGTVQRDVLGNTSGTPPTEVEMDISGQVLENISVAGVSAQAQVGDLVYATDDQTFTLTPTANVGAIGTLDRWRTGAFGDVRLFTPDEHRSTPVA